MPLFDGLSTDDAARKRLLALMAASAPQGKLPDDFSAAKRVAVDELAPPPARVAYGANGLTGLMKPQGDVPLADNSTPAGQHPRGTLPAIPESNPTSAGGPVNPASYQTPPIKVRIGTDTRGLTGSDRSATVLDAERDAVRDYPSSKVTSSGEILPPKMHHGFMDTLKSIGKGALVNINEYSKTHPNASVAELIGAAGGGAIVGGVKPVAIDRQIANDALQRHTALLGQQLGIEGEQAKVAGEQARPAIEAARVRLEDQRIKQAAADKLKEITETERHHRASESATGKSATPHESTRIVADGEYDGIPAGTAIRTIWNGKEYEDQKRGDKPLIATESTRTGKIEEDDAAKESAKQAAQDAERSGNDHSQKYGQRLNEVNQYTSELKGLGAVSPDDPRRISLEAAITQARKDAEYEKSEADKAFAERDKQNREANKKPTRGAAMSIPSPSTHQFSKSAWLAAHRGQEADLPKAIAAAQAARYQVIP